MKRQTTMSWGLVLLFVILIAAGCAGKSTTLLAEDPQKMTNEQLLEYFYRLNDEIEKQEKQTGPSFGIGIGGIGRRGGVGGGVGVGTGGTAYVAEDLRERRIQVRMELQKRNINP
ncbi:MAG: hypothetical protein R6W75_00295 [Smithellaceae bacterium]